MQNEQEATNSEGESQSGFPSKCTVINILTGFCENLQSYMQIVEVGSLWC